jgi:predicted phosphodiesterase
MNALRNLLRGFRIAALLAVFAVYGPPSLAAPGAVFNNGPYLLAPKPSSMVVAWESSDAVPATLWYGTDKDRLEHKISVAPDANAPQFQGRPMALYHVKLDQLKPSEQGTRYYYKVELEGGQAISASFSTLGTNPGAVKIVTLSDTHVFSTRAGFDADVKAIRPALIIHAGDMVEGTGAQTDQFAFWFKGRSADDFIHSYPVVYSAGNHDQGGDYFNAYVYNVQDAEYGAKVRGDSSFDFAGAHFVLLNSSPWGLFQMNSEATGKSADAETLKTIKDALDWFKSDLAGTPAKNAAFRITALHHPYTEAYTRRYIPAIAEAGRVDLVIGGHWHAYARQVSDNPDVGASTVYLTHQDARVPSKKGGYFVIDLDAAKGLMTVKNFGREKADSPAVLADTTAIARDKQQLAWSGVTISPAEILSNGEVSVSAQVKNEGQGIAAAVLPVDDNGQRKAIYTFNGATRLLAPGESATLKGTLTLAELGQHTLTLAGASTVVDVGFRPATYQYSRLRTRLGAGKVSDLASDTLFVKADVRNIGNEAGVASAELLIDGQPVDRQTLKLAAGETGRVEFSHRFARAGSYKVAIGNAPAQDIVIEGAIQGMPLVRDKSGNGNDAYIHGAPELGRDDHGRTTLVLDGRRDYLAIPDTGRFKVSDAATGMVWAKLPSKGTTKGGVSELVPAYTDGKGAVADHNPLLFKGIGLGWGTPYLFRIAVRETGKVTYGVCFEDDNGEFQWNDSSDPQAGIKKDQWVQYTSAFDFKSGGDSYQNGFRSAGVDKPVFGDAPVKNWEGTPLKIGHGFKNTLLPRRNRGMYYTMLPGEIGQVRFYTAKLPAAENDALRAEPASAGTYAQQLKVWLDFERANLVTQGTHTTEWVAVEAPPQALAYSASFAGKAGVSATVETSDDAKTVKKSATFTLQPGQQSVKLKPLGKARYARIVTRLDSDLNANESNVPVVHEYLLKAGGETRWNTLADWNRGTFAGAAGHQSEDDYRNHARDFDDYAAR